MRETREHDEHVLQLLSARSSGLTNRQIAAEPGGSPGAITRVTNKVMEADAAESGECIKGHYWGENA